MDNKIISLFSGCGGMDLGFERAGFEIPVANEFDATIWETYKRNHKNTHLIEGDIRNVTKSDLEPYLRLRPGEQLAGIIGGPPCQSWSVAGAGKGIEDKRGQLFFEYIRVLREFRPQFFVAENVPGMISKKHADAVDRILSLFAESGYNVSVYKTNACNYGLAQTRERIFYIGIRTDLDISFVFPDGDPEHIVTLKDAIWDLRDTGCFNTEVPTIMLFNKQSDWTYYDWLESDARLLLMSMPKETIQWVDKEDMTAEEKELNPSYETAGGYLKVFSQDENRNMAQISGSLDQQVYLPFLYGVCSFRLLSVNQRHPLQDASSVPLL